jgi:hypothetical protein
MVCSLATMVKVVRAAIILMALLAFSACGGGGDDKPAATSTVQNPTAVPTTEISPVAQATSAPTAQPTLEPALAALASGIPIASDLGEGWSETYRGAGASTNSQLCGEDAGYLSANTGVVALFTNSDPAAGRLYLIIGVSRSSADEATATIAKARAALQTCHELVSTAGTETSMWSIEPADVGTYGDETVAMKASTTFSGLPAPSEAYFVLVRRGSLLMTVADVSVATADPQKTKTALTAAYETFSKLTP